jgi:hypothetical protein
VQVTSKLKNTAKSCEPPLFAFLYLINHMKKISLFFLLTLSLVLTSKASSLETKLSPQGSDKYNFHIKGDAKTSEKKLRDVFQNKVNEVCGTRFEIISIKIDHLNKEGVKNNLLDGSFKCFVNSQM